VSENNESGNRWEKSAESPDASAPDVEPVETPASAPDVEPVGTPATAPSPSRLPSWVTARGLAATGAALAIFLGGGGIGYAIGASGHDDREFPGHFDRAGFQPGQGQGPGGQMPGGQGFQQGPQGQSQNQSQGSSGSDSSSTTS